MRHTSKLDKWFSCYALMILMYDTGKLPYMVDWTFGCAESPREQFCRKSICCNYFYNLYQIFNPEALVIWYMCGGLIYITSCFTVAPLNSCHKLQEHPPVDNRKTTVEFAHAKHNLIH